MNRKAFFDFLTHYKNFDHKELQHCLDESKNKNQPLAETLIQRNHFTSDTLKQCIDEFNDTFNQTIQLNSSQDNNPEKRKQDKTQFLPELNNTSLSENFLSDLAIEKMPTLELPSFNREEKKFFGKYKVIEKLAQGGMGIVYKAQHETLKQIYALKVISSLGNESPELISRFHLEARTSAKLKHPGIVQVFDSGEEEGLHYFCMEFVEGKTLEDFIDKRTPIQKKLKLIIKILYALDYAHTQGILHRDLKPQNIFITSQGEPKIGDFGLAKELVQNKANKKLTFSGEIMGTPAYMSPEQASGETENLDVTSDIYSMGACLYQLLTQQCPFEGKNLHDLFYKIISEEALPPSKLNPKIHKDLDVITLKAIEKAKSRRYQSAKALAEDIERYLQGYPILARPVSKRERFFKWTKRNQEMIFGGGIVLSAFLIFLCSSWWKTYQQQEQFFQQKWNQALSEQEKAENIQAKTKQAYSLRIKHLLNALNQVNQSLILKPKEKNIQQLKFKIAKDLIYFSCKNEEYDMANYIAREIESLFWILAKEKEEIFIEIKSEQNKKLLFHQKRLHFWIKELKKNGISQWNREIALLEISKMQEPEILAKLLEILKEGKKYFLSTKPRDSKTEEYYKTFALALGRIENPKAGYPLMNALVLMRDKVLESKQSSISDLLYMITLFQSVTYSKMPDITDDLNILRFRMGQNGLFWRETEAAFQMLSGKEPKKTTPSNLPENRNTLNKKGFKKYAAKDFKGAIEIFSKVIELYPNSASGYTNRGVVYFAMKQYPKAIADQNKALQLKPDHFLAYLNRGNAKREKNDIEGAIRDYTETIRLKPDFAHAFLYRGIMFTEKAEFSKAIKDINKAIKLNPKFANAYSARANCKYLMQQYKEALKDCKLALQNNPRYAEAYIVQAKIQIVYQQFEKAILDTTKALSIVPSYEEAYQIRAIAKEATNDFNGTIQDYTEAIHLNSKSSQYYSNRGFAKYRKKDFQGALQDIETSLTLDPKSSTAYFYRSFLQKDLNQTIQDLNQAIYLKPKNAQAYLERAKRLLEKKLIKEAAKDLRHVIQIYNELLLQDPENIRNYFLRGSCYMNLNDTKNAKKDFIQYLNKTKTQQSEKITTEREKIFKYFPELKK